MNKRPYGEPSDGGYCRHKKHRHDDSRGNQGDRQRYEPGHRDRRDRDGRSNNSQISYQDAISRLPPRTSTLGDVPAYAHFTVPVGLPPLPEITNASLQQAPFRHKSTINYNRSGVASSDLSYERLEFIGDAQLEHIASRLIYERYSHITAGQQSQLRELLVKNETLSEYAKAYGFDKRVEVGQMDRMQEDAKSRGNKGFNKILGDVFEAYVAAVILSDVENGFAIAEKWLTGLWAPKLIEAATQDRFLTAASSLLAGDNSDPDKAYNPTAKADLQKRILGGAQTKLQYEPYQSMIELKGDQLGQNKHFIAVYLTGYGYERKLLGKGEGKNKVEAGNCAAQQAMYGENKKIVDECERQLIEIREKKQAEKDALAKANEA